MSEFSMVYVNCYKDKFRDLFAESEIDTNNLIFLGVDRETLKEWWRLSGWSSDITFEFWYEWLSSAEETKDLPEYLKKHGYTFERIDFFTVDATKGE